MGQAPTSQSIAPTGMGQPPQPAAPQMAATPPQQPEQQDGEIPQSAPNIFKPVYDFCEAIEAGEDPSDVGDAIYTFADFLRASNMMPPEWRKVFTEPASTLSQFLSSFAPQIQAEPEYIEQIGQRIMEIEKMYGPEAPGGEPGPSAQQPSNVIEMAPPEPPVPEQEQEQEQEPEPEDEPEGETETEDDEQGE